jgi:hypothetical protein
MSVTKEQEKYTELVEQVGSHMRAFLKTAGYTPGEAPIPDEMYTKAAEYAKANVPGERAASVAEYMAFDSINYETEKRESLAQESPSYGMGM